MLQSGSWGWVQPRNPPFTIFGFAPTLFVVAAGIAVLAFFHHWEKRREASGAEPLVHLPLLRKPALRSGLMTLVSQNLILLGLFFTIPLYLQVVQGFNAFQTGLRLLPVSITMLAASMIAARLGRRAGPRRVVRLALLTLTGAIVWLLATIDPVIDDAQFAGAMAVLGVGMGLLASQLGNVVQSSVGEEERSEAGDCSSPPRTWVPHWAPRSSDRSSSAPWPTPSPSRWTRTRSCRSRPDSRPESPSKPASPSCPPTRCARRPNVPGSRPPRSTPSPTPTPRRSSTA